MLIPKFFWLMSLLPLMSSLVAPSNGLNATAAKADVGVILDLNMPAGKQFKTCISMAIEDFYSNRRNHSTVIVPHFRDSSNDVVAAASAAIDLLKNTQVMAIFGPLKSVQADFVIDLGDKMKVPIISPAVSPVLSPKESGYFIRSAWSSSSQAKAIAGIVRAFGWREVVFIYEDSIYGSGLAPFLTEDLQQSNVLVSYQSVLSPSAQNDQILEELRQLKAMRARVFVVHMGQAPASRFFRMAKEAGMMSKGYAWIIADVLTSFLDSVDSETIEAMQGVLGVKAYNPRTDEVKNFTKRWSERFRKENPQMDRTELNVFGLWAYDSITALAAAIEHVGVAFPRFKKSINRGNLTDLEAIGTSNRGPSLVRLIRNYRSKGLSGDFHIANGQLQPTAYEIVNVIGKGENSVGFWTAKYGISKKLKLDDDEAVFPTKRENLGAIVWPGETSDVPKKLRVGVPVKTESQEFVEVERGAETNAVRVTGFCIDLFEEIMRSLPYAVPYEYIPLYGSYDNLVYQIYLEKLDAVVGDVTISANRSNYVDFTFPYTESGVATIVPIKNNERKNAWIFLKPLTAGLWLTTGAFFVFTGFVVWVLEHRVNKEFRGPPLQQVGMIFWFSFSTLVFAHRERVMSNLTRFVLIVWVFVVLVLTSSYTASLTSMLTVQQLQPTVTNINDLIKNGEYVGYHRNSFVIGFLNNMEFDSKKFDSSKLRNYSFFKQYDEALSKGSKNGGVAAIVDEIPYIRLFLSKYCDKYTMIGPTYMTSGFGFAFQKGSPLVPDVSRAILNLKEGEKMVRILRKWFREEGGCPGTNGTEIASESLNLDSFKGLFLIAGLSSSSALAIFLLTFLYKHWYILTSSASIKRKIYGLTRAFSQEKDDISSSSSSSSKESTTPEGVVSAPSPAISVSFEREGEVSQDEGFSATEPETPIHHNTTEG